MQNWNRRRTISFVVHLLFSLVPLGASTAAALIWWHSVFNDWWAASGIVSTIEILALTSLILYITRIQWPLAWLRHFIPFLSIGPLGYELYLILEPQIAQWAIPLAIIVTGWGVFLSFQLLHSFEGLFIDPVAAMREKATEQAQALALYHASWQTANEAVQTFALSVRPIQPQITEVPSTALLQTTHTSHPKMVEIARLAEARRADGTWKYPVEAIQDISRVDPRTIEIICKLVRNGHVAVVSEADDVNS